MDNAVELDYKKLENKVQFWAIVGPMSMLMILALSLFKAGSNYLQLPLVGVVGIPFCWKWKMRGMMLSLTLLLISLFWMLYTFPIQDRFWLIGTAMAIGLGLIATFLSFEEAESIVSQVHVESNSRLENIWKLDEKLKNAQDQWKTEQQNLSIKINDLTRELNDKETQALRWEKALSLVRKDFEASQVAQERLLEEIFEKRTTIVQLTQQLEEKNRLVQERLQNIEKQSFEIQNKEQQIEELRGTTAEYIQQLEGKDKLVKEQSFGIEKLNFLIKEKELQIEELKEKVNDFESLKESYEKSIQQLYEVEECLKSQQLLSKKQETDFKETTAFNEVLIKKQRDSLNQLRSELYQAQLLTPTFTSTKQSSVETINLDSKFNQMQGKYLQLRSQFEEKSKVLDETRKELFLTEERYLKVKHEMHEAQVMNLTECEEALERHIMQFEQEQDHFKCQEEISKLQELVTTLMTQLNGKV